MMKYIAFEGVDGSGKDTQIALLARRLEREGVTPIILHEPSYGVHGRRIRAGLRSITDDIEEQRALFSADRADHVATKIKPALSFVRANPGFVILQNRSFLSASAYQPRGDGDEGLVDTVEAELRVTPMPDVIIVLDLPVEVALDRIKKQGLPDALERPDRLTKASARYRRLCELLSVCQLIDASDEPGVVASRVYNALWCQCSTA
ncbi:MULTISPECIES: dTMP kinase [unclassified Mesorhizobium]|uniref:dTMP kinase n=1 Tax=unclassified Mesorhizobium TaxID=325217 RepID=UPI00333DFF49